MDDDDAECDRLLGVREDGRSKRDLIVCTLETHTGLGLVGLDGGALASSSHAQHDAHLAPGQVDPRLQEVTHNLLLGSLAVNALQPLLVQSVRVRSPACDPAQRRGSSVPLQRSTLPVHLASSCAAHPCVCDSWRDLEP